MNKIKIGNIRFEYEVPGDTERWQLVESDGVTGKVLLQKGEVLKIFDPKELIPHYVKVDEEVAR